ncbi:hypothetical protein CDL12_02656 [Handroanthus impetiginosus]|uniref:Uncharacterized protein n=1 Tax=Handroanthus impetiginosus TaxID=429701 RepID=A0A2G9I4A8_9LAMI|nr:hypothetical protein CDL12_02656 [Handroanthus impetiginosus]
MASTVASSSSTHYISCHTKTQKYTQSQPHNILPTAKSFDQTQNFLKCSSKYGISTAICVRGNFEVKSSSSPNNPSSSWKKWLLGILLTVILPGIGYKGGLFASLKSKIDKAIETVEHVVEVAEEVVEDAEKIVEEVEEKLPGDSKLRETLESFDDLAKKAVDEAKKAEDVVHKVKDVEEQIEEEMTKADQNQVKK